jgi:hypothetical protein
MQEDALRGRALRRMKRNSFQLQSSLIAAPQPVDGFES